MKHFLKFLPLLACLMVTPARGADVPKVKVLDQFNTIDPKTLKSIEAKIKIVPTPDAAHNKVLEMVADFAKPGAWVGVMKMFPAGTINPKKYSAIRFFARSNSGTRMNVDVATEAVAPDGGPTGYYGGTITGTEEWTEITIPLSNFKRQGAKFWKDGKQMIFQGGEPLDDEKCKNLNRIYFSTSVEGRGTSTVGHFMIDGLVLVEK